MRFSTFPVLICFAVLCTLARGQRLLVPANAGETVTILPSDLTVLEAAEGRNDLPCTATQRKADLGFDLRFHTGYDVSVPMRELAGDGDLLTVVMRMYAQGDKAHPSYFVQHFTVPAIGDDAKGDAYLQGSMDVGEGSYHVDWLMRDRSERFCSTSWDTDAVLTVKDKLVPLFIKNNQIAESVAEPFSDQAIVRPQPQTPERLDLKLLVNFAPQLQGSAALQRTDLDALVTILKELEEDSHVGRISLVAFNVNETRVVYRQDAADKIDFPALGKALKTMHLGTVNLQNLGKTSETDFLENLIQTEMTTDAHPDAVIFAGPKLMLEANVPQEDLRRIGEIECPVFYLNYNLDPQALPWKDSISHAIRVFHGTEYSISRPREVWSSTTDLLGKLVKMKHDRVVATASNSGTSNRALR